MKKAWMLVFLLWAGNAWAQQDLYDGQKIWLPHGGVGGGFFFTDSTYHVFRTNSTGAVYFIDSDRDRDLNGFVPGGQNAINDTLTVGSGVAMAANPGGETFTAESTAVLSVGPYRYLALSMRVIPTAPVDTTLKYEFAIQIREHDTNSADSSSTHAFYGWQFAGTAANVDSTGQNAAPPTGAGVGVWSSEKLFDFFPYQGQAALKSNQFFGMPNGLYGIIVGARGEVFRATFMSVRVRCLSGGTKPKVILSVLGGS